jgi:high-affinity nickel-transport protein
MAVSAAAHGAPRTRLSFTPAEWGRLGGMYGFIVFLHVVGWGFFLYYAHDFGPVYASAGALAYTFGLRHAFDADHIAAIDDTTRFLMQRGQRPLGVGFFFSLGHSTIVFGLSLGLAVATQAVQQHIASFRNVGGFIGATVSGTFLWIVGIFNLIVFMGIWKVWQQMKRGTYDQEHLEELLVQRGFMNRLLGRRFKNFVSKSSRMYPVGVLFGLGFDTASEVGLLALTAVAATQRQGGAAGAEHIPFMGIICLPVLFAAGMALMDTTDGVFMSRAYDWAFTSPVRKIYYNLTTTGLSVFVALVVGTIEYLQVISNRLHIDSGFFNWLNNLDFETLGYAIVATFILAWALSVAMFKFRRIEERWAPMVASTPDPRPVHPRPVERPDELSSARG